MLLKRYVIENNSYSWVYTHRIVLAFEYKYSKHEQVIYVQCTFSAMCSLLSLSQFSRFFVNFCFYFIYNILNFVSFRLLFQLYIFNKARFHSIWLISALHLYVVLFVKNLKEEKSIQNIHFIGSCKNVLASTHMSIWCFMNFFRNKNIKNSHRASG